MYLENGKRMKKKFRKRKDKHGIYFEGVKLLDSGVENDKMGEKQ